MVGEHVDPKRGIERTAGYEFSFTYANGKRLRTEATEVDALDLQQRTTSVKAFDIIAYNSRTSNKLPWSRALDHSRTQGVKHRLELIGRTSAAI